MSRTQISVPIAGQVGSSGREPDEGVSQHQLDDPYFFNGDKIKDAVQRVMTSKALSSHMDVDLADYRPGRGYYVMAALMEELVLILGSERKAADTLVLTAVRTAGEYLNRCPKPGEERRRRRTAFKSRN